MKIKLLRLICLIGGVAFLAFGAGLIGGHLRQKSESPDAHVTQEATPSSQLQEQPADADGVCADVDNCPAVANPDQHDCNGNGIGDACDDVNPTALEICDGLDNNCDGVTDEGFADLGSSCTAGEGVCQASGTMICSPDGLDTECDATPGAPTGIDNDCNGLDDDCDGGADEDYVPTDTSCGVGECAAAGQTTCFDGAVLDSCVPGPPSPETCDGLDNDCDGLVDADDPDCAGLATFYYDADCDGYGNPSVSVQACTPPAGFVIPGTDCDDTSIGVYPGADEICDNGIDDDCDELVDGMDPQC